ncbi:MAG: PIN domain-containing protein [Dyadobacter sp.]
MIYFDTDVIINYLVEQESTKHRHAIQLVQDASKSGLFFCSLLCLQESAFVLSKLKVPDVDIEGMMMELINFQTVNYTETHYKRAIQLARRIGFQNINDCLHTSLAESYCDELYTYNVSDFKKIKNFTMLKVTIF